MSRPLKRKAGLREGLRRVSEELLQDLLQIMRQERLMGERVHDARKVIKNLRAILRLTRGALSDEARKVRNQAFRNLTGPLSGPRDAAVTLATFEKAYHESMNGDPPQRAEPAWASKLCRSLADKAHALVPAESYQPATEEVRRLGGQLLPFEDARSGGGPSQNRDKDDWDSTVGEGLRKTYRRSRGIARQVAANSEPSDEKWHELRKRIKDLDYQLTLFKKVKGIKPLLRKLDDAGTALGDARDLIMLGECLAKVQDKGEFTRAERRDYQRLLMHVEEQKQILHRRALKVIKGVCRHKSKRFTARLAKRFRQWQGG
jgi:CHAD domain-containing protein